METMRRHVITLAVLGLFGAMMGCNHTAGVCDCEGPGGGCCGGGAGMAPSAPGILRPEPLKMPKENGEAKPAALPMDKAKDIIDAEK
jgi:hypothetical protein